MTAVDHIVTPGEILTFSGLYVTPLDLQPEHVCIEDIAHALSNQCRWTGHVSRFYSVAEHSLNVAALVSKEMALTALLHDATEAYLADLARPIKKAAGLGAIYLEVEAKLAMAIAVRFDIEADPLAFTEIKEADERMLWAEAKVLLPVLGKQMPDPGEQALALVGGFYSSHPEHVERRFLRAFADYGGESPDS